MLRKRLFLTALGVACLAGALAVNLLGRVPRPGGRRAAQVQLGGFTAETALPTGRGSAEAEPAAGQDDGQSVQAFSGSSRRTPAATLTGALEAVAGGEAGVLPAFFAEAAVRDNFVRQWQGQLPVGTTLVENADQLNAGAENGWPVTVTVWISDSKQGRVAGLTGDIQFRPVQSGYVIDRIALKAVPLKVATWAQASRLVKAPDVKPTGAPFYGVYRLQAGGAQYAIDARTGAVEAE